MEKNSPGTNPYTKSIEKNCGKNINDITIDIFEISSLSKSFSLLSV